MRIPEYREYSVVIVVVVVDGTTKQFKPLNQLQIHYSEHNNNKS